MEKFDLTDAKDGDVVAQIVDDYGIVDFIWHEECRMIWADRVIVTRIRSVAQPG